MQTRFKLDQLLSERYHLSRFRGRDTGGSGARSIPVIILREQLTTPATPPQDSASDDTHFATELPRFHYPSLQWERTVLETSLHLTLPRVLEFYRDEQHSYLVEEAFEGRPILEAWNESDIRQADRFQWIEQLVEGMIRLHEAGALIGPLEPQRIGISPSGQLILLELDYLLPQGMHEQFELPNSLYLAPEIASSPGVIEARADQYSLGVFLYSLLLGRPIEASDFLRPGLIRPIVDFFPDLNPLFGRLIGKLVQPLPENRFPSLDRKHLDPSGMTDVLDTVRACIRNLDRITLQISAWTTTGSVRTGNEDTISMIQFRESIFEDPDDYALLILADGMGGSEGGEIASSLTVQSVREYLLQEPPFGSGLKRKSGQSTTQIQRVVSPSTPAATEIQMNPVKVTPETVQQPALRPDQTDPDFRNRIHETPEEIPMNLGTKWLQEKQSSRDSMDRETSTHQQRMMRAIREANQKVFEASQTGFGQRGMGATLEVVIIDNNQAIIGHVGDSRVYHARDGKIQLITHDQTFVFREVAEGRLTPEEAENHPRRSELQQAVGGRIDIFPNFYTQELQAGDWLIICSDGLSNIVRPAMMEEILQVARCSDQAARRLINRANQNFSPDNVSVIVVRVL